MEELRVMKEELATEKKNAAKQQLKLLNDINKELVIFLLHQILYRSRFRYFVAFEQWRLECGRGNQEQIEEIINEQISNFL